MKPGTLLTLLILALCVVGIIGILCGCYMVAIASMVTISLFAFCYALLNPEVLRYCIYSQPYTFFYYEDEW